MGLRQERFCFLWHRDVSAHSAQSSTVGGRSSVLGRTSHAVNQ